MSELRLYLRRDSLMEGMDCAWALLDDAGHPQSSGTRLEDPPRAGLCRLVLASDLVLSIDAPLPDLPERRLAPLLAAAAESATLLDADDLHAVLMERGENGMATLAALDDVWLGRVLARLTELGLHADAALPEYLLLPWEPGTWSVCYRGKDTLARLGLSQGLALDDGEPPVGLALAQAQRGKPEAVKVFQANNLGAPDWPRWRAGLGTKVESAGTWDWRGAPWPDLPNLLQGKHASRRNRIDWKRLARPLAWGVLALFCVQFTGLVLDWALLAHEQSNIKREMRVLAERALPAHAAVMDPAWQVAERLQQLHTASGSPPPDSFVGFLGRLGQVWPAGALAQTLSYENGVISVSLAQADPSWLEQLRSAAAGRGLAVATSQDDKGGGVQLSIKPSAKDDRHGQ